MDALRLLRRDNSRDSAIVPTSSTQLHASDVASTLSELSHQFYSTHMKLVLLPSYTSSVRVPLGQEDSGFVTSPAPFPRANPQRFQKQKDKQYLPPAVPEV